MDAGGRVTQEQLPKERKGQNKYLPQRRRGRREKKSYFKYLEHLLYLYTEKALLTE
jgi:hypothetical protein